MTIIDKDKIKVTVESWSDEESGFYLSETLYVDEDFGYYDRIASICWTDYHLIIRFRKQEFPKVLKRLATKGNKGLERFVGALDGSELIIMEHLC